MLVSLGPPDVVDVSSGFVTSGFPVDVCVDDPVTSGFPTQPNHHQNIERLGLLVVLTPDSLGVFVVEHSTLQQLHRMSACNRMAAKDREP